MILVDKPQLWPGKRKPWAHLISDLPGKVGREELVRFAVRCGLRRDYLQHRGTSREHFDVTGIVYEKAVALGAKKIGRTEFVEAMRFKRAAGEPV